MEGDLEHTEESTFSYISIMLMDLWSLWIWDFTIFYTGRVALSQTDPV